jgi:hypothetical protein
VRNLLLKLSDSESRKCGENFVICIKMSEKIAETEIMEDPVETTQKEEKCVDSVTNNNDDEKETVTDNQ